MNLKFVDPMPFFDLSFWIKLNKYKVEMFKLDESFIKVSAHCPLYNTTDMPLLVNIDENAFNNNVSQKNIIIPGHLCIYNTMEYFEKIDKKFMLCKYGNKMLDHFKEDIIINSFFILCFADIKKYKYYYWIAFPTFLYPSGFIYVSSVLFEKFFTPAEMYLINNNLEKMVDSINKFSIYVFEDYRLCSIKELKNLENISLAIVDPSMIKSEEDSYYPSSFMKNILTYLKIKLDEIKSKNTYHVKLMVFKFFLCNTSNTFVLSQASTLHNFKYEYKEENDYILHPNLIKYGGYIKNKEGKLKPHVLNLAPVLDPLEVADSACKLNIRLMKWRVIPELDLDSVFKTKCLLFGAGTLGCNVARCLLGWGITHITFVDNGKVSYSNPSRQSLFTFKDALISAKQPEGDEQIISDDINFDLQHCIGSKAIIAAEALKKIYPKAQSKGYKTNIPCPGHNYSDKQDLMKNIDLLDKLITEHDVIFLLTDTRESRWLPTVIGAVKGKVVITAALGLDSFLVMRHGTRNLETTQTECILPTSNLLDNSFDSSIVCGTNLGCYFCSDIIGPTDTLHDRTLDQQCTVTRPGLSSIASGLCVELVLSLLQHPLRVNAPAIANSNPKMSSEYQSSLESCLGIIPHQIRGYLSNFSMIHPISMAFDKCIACSYNVLQKYGKDIHELILNVFDPEKSISYLEKISGIQKLKNEANTINMTLYSSDDSDNQ